MSEHPYLQLGTCLAVVLGCGFVMFEYKLGLWPPKVKYKLFLGFYSLFVASLYAMEHHLEIGGFINPLWLVFSWEGIALLNFWSYFAYYKYQKQ